MYDLPASAAPFAPYCGSPMSWPQPPPSNTYSVSAVAVDPWTWTATVQNAVRVVAAIADRRLRRRT